MVHNLYLASPVWGQTDDSDQLAKSMPVKMAIYPYDDIGNYQKWRLYSVEGFMAIKPDFRWVDITACFTEKQIATKQIQMSWNPAMDIPDTRLLIEQSIRAMTAELAKVTQLRINQIMIDVDPLSKVMYVTLTIVDKADVMDENLNIPTTATLPLKDAVNNLRNAVKNGQFQISVEENGSDNTLTSKANKDYFFDVARTDAAPPNHNHDHNHDHNDSSSEKKTRYSGGAMAGLAFGMIFLGLALSTVLYLFVLKRFLPTRIPYTQGIENPVHYSANSE